MKKNKYFLYLMIIFTLFLCIIPCESQESGKNIKSFDVVKQFSPSGWVGDYEQIQYLKDWTENPYKKPFCIKIVYNPGPKGWAGIYWLNKPNNWGQDPGEDFSKEGYKKITFYARGEKGTEIVEFKAGGIKSPGNQYIDSFEVTTGKIYLMKEWKKYTLDLKGQDISNVIGGFCWTAFIFLNPEGLTFYLDDIVYETHYPLNVKLTNEAWEAYTRCSSFFDLIK